MSHVRLPSQIRVSNGTMASPGFVPSVRELGFVIKSDEKCGIEDYLEAVAAIIGAENIKTFGRIRSNFGVSVG